MPDLSTATSMVARNFDRILELPEDWGIEMRCLCSHFGCNVFHESLVLRNDVDAEAGRALGTVMLEGTNV